MSLLSIEEYDRKEVDAIRSSSNRYIEAFSPNHFNAFGYPSRVKHERELFNFVDVMQEERFAFYFEKLRGVTEEEGTLYLSLASDVAQICEKKFKSIGCGKSALAHSLNVVRHIQFLTDGSPQRVFEMGPGCGYVGAMLTALGYGYMGHDVTQAFYIYQNFLWSHLYGSRVYDLAHEAASGKLIGELLQKTGKESVSIHLPWWEYSKLPSGVVPTVDIITCNHVLCEMHSASLSFFAKLSRMMLDKSNGAKLIVFEGWGWNAMNRVSTVLGEFYRHGFVLAHQDDNITVLALRSSVPNGLFLELEHGFHGGGMAFATGKCYLDEYVKNFQHPNSEITRKLEAARSKLLSKPLIDGATIRAELVRLVGEDGLVTEDERFMQFIREPLR